MIIALTPPEELNMEEYGDVFFVSYPLTGGISVPRPETRTGSGPGTALRRGHEIKKDIFILP